MWDTGFKNVSDIVNFRNMHLKFANVQILSPIKIDSISASSQITTTSVKNISDLRIYVIQEKG